MTSSRKRGADLANRLEKAWKAKGWLVAKARPRLQYIGPGRVIQAEEDFFGLFDLIASCNGCPRHLGDAGWHLAQITTEKGANERYRRLESGGLEKFPAGSSFELWFWRAPGTTKRKYAVDVSVGWILDSWVLGRWVGPVPGEK